MRTPLLILSAIVISSCGYSLKKDSDAEASAVQVVCYSDDGKPLFPPQIGTTESKLTDDGVLIVYANGLHAEARARSCIAAQMTAADAKALQSPTQPTQPSAPPPMPPPTPPSATTPNPDDAIHKALESYSGEHDKFLKEKK